MVAKRRTGGLILICAALGLLLSLGLTGCGKGDTAAGGGTGATSTPPATGDSGAGTASGMTGNAPRAPGK